MVEGNELGGQRARRRKKSWEDASPEDAGLPSSLMLQPVINIAHVTSPSHGTVDPKILDELMGQSCGMVLDELLEQQVIQVPAGATITLAASTGALPPFKFEVPVTITVSFPLDLLQLESGQEDDYLERTSTSMAGSMAGAKASDNTSGSQDKREGSQDKRESERKQSSRDGRRARASEDALGVAGAGEGHSDDGSTSELEAGTIEDSSIPEDQETKTPQPRNDSDDDEEQSVELLGTAIRGISTSLVMHSGFTPSDEDLEDQGPHLLEEPGAAFPRRGSQGRVPTPAHLQGPHLLEDHTLLERLSTDDDGDPEIVTVIVSDNVHRKKRSQEDDSSKPGKRKRRRSPRKKKKKRQTRKESAATDSVGPNPNNVVHPDSSPSKGSAKKRSKKKKKKAGTKSPKRRSKSPKRRSKIESPKRRSRGRNKHREKRESQQEQLGDVNHIQEQYTITKQISEVPMPRGRRALTPDRERDIMGFPEGTLLKSRQGLNVVLTRSERASGMPTGVTLPVTGISPMEDWVEVMWKGLIRRVLILDHQRVKLSDRPGSRTLVVNTGARRRHSLSPGPSRRQRLKRNNKPRRASDGPTLAQVGRLGRHLPERHSVPYSAPRNPGPHFPRRPAPPAGGTIDGTRGSAALIDVQRAVLRDALRDGPGPHWRTTHAVPFEAPGIARPTNSPKRNLGYYKYPAAREGLPDRPYPRGELLKSRPDLPGQVANRPTGGASSKQGRPNASHGPPGVPGKGPRGRRPSAEKARSNVRDPRGLGWSRPFTGGKVNVAERTNERKRSAPLKNGGKTGGPGPVKVKGRVKGNVGGNPAAGFFQKGVDSRASLENHTTSVQEFAGKADASGPNPAQAPPPAGHQSKQLNGGPAPISIHLVNRTQPQIAAVL